jgi:DNA-binding NarL/FixJ family response regulator
VRKAEELQPHLIVLDVNLPGLSGIDAARQIRTVAPESTILFLTQEAGPDVARTALRSGARGYVLKDDLAGDLVAAIEAVILGKRFVSRGLAATTSAALGSQALSKPTSLGSHIGLSYDNSGPQYGKLYTCQQIVCLAIDMRCALRVVPSLTRWKTVLPKSMPTT